MYSDAEPSGRRVPTLVQLCQRVAGVNVDCINSLGDELRYDLVKPILERCSTDQLLRLEHASPHLQKDTPEIWRDLCFRKYPSEVERHAVEAVQEPESWKDHYFMLKEAEAKRIEEVGSRLRSQRMEAEERKKEREVKLTDRVPEPKRQRSGGWGGNLQPKTLFQKTRTEASKLQKTIYNSRIIPPMPGARNYRVLPERPSAALPPVPSNQTSRVTVNTVVHRRPLLVSTPSPTTLSSLSRPTPPPLSTSSSSHSLSPPMTSPIASRPPSTISFQSKSPLLPSSASSTVLHESRPFKSPKPMKKDPMSSLFVPKHRAHSQRPV
ncbi:RNA polymerase II transcription factor SIII subunit A-domain-containing protein [Crucibulum laeve]|uniref:RNA polymerase II transcription factor SIII subunit A-domain-containing protein n=1 Tax=Crucibulum laeve TaxID=68775 RepID=A0A5C3MAT0_9AGAR|nr:RNA polymerase II transcription factor SIII subunit A-domain-containing protein [Crucibulum laeve]